MTKKTKFIVKKLIKHGNSLALVIDKLILDLLKITDKTELELLIEDGDLIIRPSKKKTKSLKADDIDKIADRVIKKYEPVLRKLSKT